MNTKFKDINDLEEWINNHDSKLSIEETIFVFDEHKRLLEEIENRRAKAIQQHQLSFKYEIEGFEGSIRTDRFFTNEDNFDEIFSQVIKYATRVIVRNQRTGVEVSYMTKYLDKVDFKKLRED